MVELSGGLSVIRLSCFIRPSHNHRNYGTKQANDKKKIFKAATAGLLAAAVVAVAAAAGGVVVVAVTIIVVLLMVSFGHLEQLGTG